MLPWLIDLGLGVIDLGLAAAALALVLESVPAGRQRLRRAQSCPAREDEDAADADRDP